MRRYVFPTVLLLTSAVGWVLAVHSLRSQFAVRAWGVREVSAAGRWTGALFGIVFSITCLVIGINGLRIARGKPEVDYAGFFGHLRARIRRFFTGR